MNPIIIIGGIAFIGLVASTMGRPAEEPDPDPGIDPGTSYGNGWPRPIFSTTGIQMGKYRQV